jgi:hypothetical protein
LRKLAALAAAFITFTAQAEPQAYLPAQTYTIYADLDTTLAPRFPDGLPHPYGYAVLGEASLTEWGLFSEWTNVFAEFDIRGLAAGPATLTFTYLNGAQFLSPTREPPGPNASFYVSAYGGDLAPPTIMDYFLLNGSGREMGVFTVPPVFGTVFTFDVTDALAAYKLAGHDAFGVRLRPDLLVFADTTTNWGDFTLTVAAVPEPGTYALLLAGLGATCVMRRRRQQNRQ